MSALEGKKLSEIKKASVAEVRIVENSIEFRNYGETTWYFVLDNRGSKLTRERLQATVRKQLVEAAAGNEDILDYLISQIKEK